MKQIICEKPGKLVIRDVPIPDIKPDEVLIRIRRIGICGTDLHAFEGTQPYFNYPRVLGHELSGDVVETGNRALEFKSGEKVTFMPYFACHSCQACRSGKSNCCRNMTVAGVHIDGGMSEFYAVPSRYVFHGGDITRCNLALVEPLSISAHAIRIAGVCEGETVLVTGSGPIGIGAAIIAKAMGANVIAMDINTDRLDFIKNAFYIKQTVNASDHPVDQIRELTQDEFAPVIIDATGSRKAIESGLQFLAHGGRFILVGLQREPFSFSHPEFHKRETMLHSSRNATKEDFENVISLIASGQLDPSPMVTHRMDFFDLPGNFSNLLDPTSRMVKTLINLD
jgi:2-desacetyl-2-hydroxyethyl bacteriochlorophyllide A dehydrogenase